ncbi:MAG: SOS response-associated peptidase, partial [Ketobacter sp.]
DHHPIMNRMHKPDPAYGPDDQDKRSVVSIELEDFDTWLTGSNEEALQLIRAPSVDCISGAPAIS